MINLESSFDSQGVRLTGRLVVPDASEVSSAVLCVTGGGTEHCDTYYLELQKQMAAKGIASYAYNARGIGGSGGYFRTDSDGYFDGAPVNSDETRILDVIHAFRFLRYEIAKVDMFRIGIIGGSMGGNFTVRALAMNTELYPGAVVLRAPSAYPEGIDPVKYGPEWRPTVAALGGVEAAKRSKNFATMQRLAFPMMLIYSEGENVVPKSIQDCYEEAASSAHGEIHRVGDEHTGHTYLNAQNNPDKVRAIDAAAKLDTFDLITKFFSRYLLSE